MASCTVSITVLSSNRIIASRSRHLASRRCRDRAIRHFGEQTVCRPVNAVPQIGQDGTITGVRTLQGECSDVEWGIGGLRLALLGQVGGSILHSAVARSAAIDSSLGVPGCRTCPYETPQPLE